MLKEAMRYFENVETPFPPANIQGSLNRRNQFYINVRNGLNVTSRCVHDSALVRASCLLISCEHIQVFNTECFGEQQSIKTQADTELHD